MDQQDRVRFLQTLEEDAQFRNDVRNLLLTQELLDLPERFAQFSSFVTRFMEDQKAFNERQEAFNQRTDESLNTLKAHAQRTDESLDTLKAHAQRTDESLDTLKAHAQRTDESLDTLKAHAQRTDESLGILKGNVARRLLFNHHEDILEAFNLDFVAILQRTDLIRIVRQSGLSKEIELGQRLSFYQADMVLEGTDQQGDTHYVAAEASFTADDRDSGRAARNAGFLTRMTGNVAHPMVASVSNDHAVQELVQAGTLHWLQFDQKEFDPD